MKIFLADLTYTQQTLASDVVPAAVAGIAEYLLRDCRSYDLEVKIFKYPETLLDELEVGFPDIIGFSNYIWNSSLSFEFARLIKAHSDNVITVMGGPNFPTERVEQKAFLTENRGIDYYIVKEAEKAFAELVKYIIKYDKADENIVEKVPNLVFLDELGTLRESTKIERIMDLSLIPSPYLSGRLDEFLDGKLVPVIQTNRGCPFTCTFCTEGQSYWTKVKKKPAKLVADEIAYIAEAMNQLPAKAARKDLLISDSNFGMFPEDLETANVIHDQQEKYSYPSYINVATGKNKKERVLEVAKIVNGAMKLSGSVQSLDSNVQSNIKRSNISTEQILDLSLRASEIGANSYSELILALPGETLESHLSSLGSLVDSGFNTISMYQLMMLPGTEMGAEETRLRFGMLTKYRVVPRCFGRYSFRGKHFVVAEIEEICVSTNTLSYNDYLNARKMHFIVNIFYNDGLFRPQISILRQLGLSVWDFLLEIFQDTQNSKFSELVESYLMESEQELFESQESLSKFMHAKGNLERYIAGELGSNLIFKYKSLGLTEFIDEVFDFACEALLGYVRKASGVDEKSLDIIAVSFDLRKAQVKNFYTCQSAQLEASFLIPDIDNIILSEIQSSSSRQKVTYELTFDQAKESDIAGLVQLFGSDATGLSRVLSRINSASMYRNIAVVS